MRGYLFPSGYSLACQHLGLAISLRVPSLKRGRTSNFHPRVGHRTVISIIGITRFRLPFLSSEPTSSLPKSCIVQPKKKNPLASTLSSFSLQCFSLDLYFESVLIISCITGLSICTSVNITDLFFIFSNGEDCLGCSSNS